MKMSRRIFLKQSAMVGGALMAASMLPKFGFANKEAGTITILHTNDIHGYLDPLPPDAGRFAGLGGAAARAALIKQIREEAKNILLLDAGDMLQGASNLDLYKGEAVLKSMSRMGYDAATIGDHDFDAGIENFASKLKHANFPIIISNYCFTATPMENKYIPYKIFQKENLKLGVLGIGIALEGLVSEGLYGNTICLAPIECANNTASVLKKSGCDLIICLSHLGDKYADNKISDEVLAKECFDIDFIIGGHSHRLLEAPRVYRNRKGGDTVVNQVGWAGVALGRLDYLLDRSRVKRRSELHLVAIGKKNEE